MRTNLHHLIWKSVGSHFVFAKVTECHLLKLHLSPTVCQTYVGLALYSTLPSTGTASQRKDCLPATAPTNMHDKTIDACWICLVSFILSLSLITYLISYILYLIYYILYIIYCISYIVYYIYRLIYYTLHYFKQYIYIWSDCIWLVVHWSCDHNQGCACCCWSANKHWRNMKEPTLPTIGIP